MLHLLLLICSINSKYYPILRPIHEIKYNPESFSKEKFRWLEAENVYQLLNKVSDRIIQGIAISNDDVVVTRLITMVENIVCAMHPKYIDFLDLLDEKECDIFEGVLYSSKIFLTEALRNTLRLHKHIESNKYLKPKDIGRIKDLIYFLEKIVIRKIRQMKDRAIYLRQKSRRLYTIWE